MNLLRNITAVGLAGCMLLMGTVPEAAALTAVAESSTPAAAKVDPEVAFRDVLDMFRKNVSEGWANFDGTTAEGVLNSEDLSVVSPLWLDEYKDKGLDEVGYEYDTNNKCLYIGVSDSEYSGAEVYSLKDGKPVHLCASGETYTIKCPVTADFRPDEATYIQLHYQVTDGVMTPTYAYKEENGYWYSDPVTLNSDGSYNFDWKEATADNRFQYYRPTRSMSFTPLSAGQPATEPTEPAAEASDVCEITIPENIKVGLNSTQTVNLEIISKDGRTISAINGSNGAAPAFSLSWAIQRPDSDHCTVPVTIRAQNVEGVFSPTLKFLITFADGGSVEKQVRLPFTIGDPAAASLYEITVPEIPEMVTDRDYEFKVTVTRTDGKPVGTISSARKVDEDGRYYAVWGEVSKDASTVTVPVLLTPKKPFSGEVQLGISMQITDADGNAVPAEQISEAAFALTITEPRSVEVKLPPIPVLSPGETYHFNAEMILSSAEDFKAVKTGGMSATKSGESSTAYSVSWETVTFDQEGHTSYQIPFTITAGDNYEGTIEVNLADFMYAFIFNDGNGAATKDMITTDPLICTVRGGAEAPDRALGDLNGDSTVNASDAAVVLIAAARIGAGNDSGLTVDQLLCADVNGDTIVNASDAAIILQYAAKIGAGGEGTLAEYLEARK